MDPNPYLSPRPGEPFDEKLLPDTSTIQKLLVEIRDTQRELLEVQRDNLRNQQEVMARTQNSLRNSRYFMIVPILIILASLYFSFTRIRSIPVLPPRPIPRAVPVPAPKAPMTSQLQFPEKSLPAAN